MRTFSLIFVSLLSIAILANAQAAAPTATDNTITMSEDNTYTFSAADFGYLDADEEPFTSIKITTLETVGTLRFFNSHVTSDQEIFVANLASLTFKPALDQFQNGYDSFQFTVNDGVESSAAHNTITIDVLPVDDLPVFSVPPLDAVDEDSPYLYTPEIYDVDSSFSPLIFSIENQPVWITAFDNTSGTLSGSPDNSHVGVHSNIIITVEDSDGLITPLPAFSITVNNTNDAPAISGTPATSVNENTPYSFKANVTDVDDPDTTSFNITNQPDWADFDTDTGTLSGTPGNEDVGIHANISIEITDAAGASDTLDAFDITVINVNNAPTFTNNPPTSVNEDASYDFILTATDVDSADDGLVFSITPGTTLPDWLDFDENTQILSSETGRPHNNDVGTYNNISFTVTDNEGDKSKSTAFPLFSITVNNINDVPGSISIDGMRKEGELLTVNTTLLTDEDGLGTFRYLWQRIDANGTTNIGTNNSYQLVNADFVASPIIKVTVSYTDRRGTDESVWVSTSAITGNTPVQGDVTIIGQAYIGQTLTAITSELSDGDDIIGTFSYKWRHNGVAGVVGTDSSNYLLSAADEGQTITVTVSYTDGAGYDESVTSASTIPVTINPVQDSDGDGMTDSYEIEHGLNPNVDDAAQDLDGDGISNLDESLDNTKDPRIDDYPPANFDAPADPAPINSTGLLTAVDLGTATTIDGKDGTVTATPDNSGPFRPGIHTISWTATDAAGNSTTASTTQTVSVIPMVNFAIDQISNEGTTATVSVHLNGPAVTPTTLDIPFTLSGTADSNDHTIATNVISIDPGNVSGSIPVTLTDADIAENDETLIFTMGDVSGIDVIAGHKTTHTIIITELNIAPKLSLLMTQGGTHTSTILADTDPDPDNAAIVFATVTALVSDTNAKAALDWSESDNALADTDGNPTNDTFIFDPSLLNIGTYTIVVKASDDGDLVTTQKHHFKIVASASGDHHDNDGDGIANKYDKIALSHAVALQQADQSRHLVETEPGLQLRLGAIAFESGTNGLQVSASAIETYTTNIRFPNDAYFNVGGLSDFEIHGLATAGDSVQVVIPLRNQIPTNPSYRKLVPTGWQDFFIDDNNTLASAAGSNGSCPRPNSSAYSPGLTPGHFCVQLLLEDGSDNDADGKANGVIIGPGGVAVEPLANERPTPQRVLPLPDTGGGTLYSLLLLLLVFAYSRSYQQHRGSAPQPRT